VVKVGTYGLPDETKVRVIKETRSGNGE